MDAASITALMQALPGSTGGFTVAGILAWALHLSFQSHQTGRRQAKIESNCDGIGDKIDKIHDFCVETGVILTKMQGEIDANKQELRDHLEEAESWKIRIAQLETQVETNKP